MRSFIAALLVVLFAAVMSNNFFVAADNNKILAYPTGCVYRKTFPFYNASNGYNGSALFFTSIAKERNAPNFLVQSYGMFQVNMYGGQVNVIGLVRDATDLMKLNANSGDDQNIAYTTGGVSSNQLQVGQIYWITGSSNDFGSASFAVQVVALGSSSTTVDIVSFSQNVGGQYSNGCFSVQSSFTVSGRCASDAMIPYTATCQLN